MTKTLQKRIELFFSLSIYFGASFLMLLQTRLTFEFFDYNFPANKMLLSFAVGGLGVYLPLLILAFLILRSEKHDFFYSGTWKDRMRFVKLKSKDLLWCVGSIASTLILMGGFMKLITFCCGELDFIPPFLDFPKISDEIPWGIFSWPLFFFANIMGIEVLFRGVMQPRQENTIGNKAWLLQAIGLIIVDIAFGWQLLLIKLPAKFIIPYVVQKTQNTWNGVIIHGVINAIIYLYIVFG